MRSSPGIAELSGVYTRLAALEMLLFPDRAARRRTDRQVTAALGIGGGALADADAAGAGRRSCRRCCSSGGPAGSCRCG